jgi:hypothetical protein
MVDPKFYDTDAMKKIDTNRDRIRFDSHSRPKSPGASNAQQPIAGKGEPVSGFSAPIKR